MENPAPPEKDPDTGRGEAAAPRPEPPASWERSLEAPAATEPVTAYDHLWFERRPIR